LLPADLRAFAVHIFTAAGAALALAALVAATGHRWDIMFYCLGGALFVDGIDGTIARRFEVAKVLPRWSGEVLDLVVDFVTYVFVPAYAIATGAILPPVLDLPAGILIVVTGAIYFADRQMKTPDNYFRGFPALWNGVAFYLFLLKPNPWVGAVTVAAFAILTFIPFKFVHPFRVARWRNVSIAVVTLGSVLALFALMHELAPGPWVSGALVLVGVYFLSIGLLDKVLSD
jgi:phosphatidylcholine synthase